MGLKKYTLKNLPKDAKEIISSKLPHGRVSIGNITDAEAEILYNNGKGYYVGLAETKQAEKPADKK